MIFFINYQFHNFHSSNNPNNYSRALTSEIVLNKNKPNKMLEHIKAKFNSRGIRFRD